jgi:DNA-binding Lrp family transcriptional regulator
LEITESHTLFGGYDIVARVEAENYEKLGDIVLNKIRTIEGVMDTVTLTGTKFQ